MKALIHALMLTAAALSFMPRSLPAQSVTRIDPGARVRFSVAGQEYAGKVIAMASDTLALSVDGLGTFVVLHRRDIRDLEVSVGQHRHVLKGLGIGFLSGGVTGALLGYATGDDMCGQYVCILGEKEFKSFALGVVGGVFGAVGGLIAGYVNRSDQWVGISQWGIGLTPIADASGRLGVSLRY